MKGVEAVFLLAAGHPRQSELEGNLVEAAKRAGVRRVVKASIFGARADSPFKVAREHGLAEEHLAASGLGYTILQPRGLMQNLLGAARSIASRGVFSGAMGQGRIGWVDIRDLAAVAVAALHDPAQHGKTHVVTGPEALSYWDVAARLSAAIGRRIDYLDMPPADYALTMLDEGAPRWVAVDSVANYTLISAGQGDVVTTVVADVTGRPPRSFDDFARDHAAIFRGD